MRALLTPLTPLFLILLFLIAVVPLASLAQAAPAEEGPGTIPEVLELRYVYSPINSTHFEKVYLGYIGGRLPPETRFIELYLTSYSAIIRGSASKLGLKGYRPSIEAFIGGRGLSDSCILAAESASATVKISSSRLLEEVSLEGALLACIGNLTSMKVTEGALRLARGIMSLLHVNASLKIFNLTTIERGSPETYPVAAAYLGNVSVSAMGRVDRDRWAILDEERHYVGDFLYLLPPGINGSTFLNIALIPVSEDERLLFKRDFNVTLEGWALLYCINMSDTTNLTYNVKGLGRVPGYDTTYSPCLTLGPSVQTIYKLSSPSDASKLAGMLKEASGSFLGAVSVKVEDSMVSITWKAPLLLEAYSRLNQRYWSVVLCNRSAKNLAFRGVRILKERDSVICLRVGRGLYGFTPMLLLHNEGILVYSRSRGVLLEVVGLPTRFLATANPVPASLAWGRFKSLPGVSRVVLVGLPDGFLSARLVEARELQGMKPLALEAGGRVRWYRSAALASLVALVVAVPLFATRRPLASLGVLLLALGLGMALSRYAGIASGGSRATIGGPFSGFNYTLYVYGDYNDVFDVLVKAAPCFYNTTLSASADGRSWVSRVEETGSTSGTIKLGDPMIYRVSISFKGERACGNIEALLDVMGSPTAKPLRGLARAGIVMASIGAILAAAGFLAPRGRGSLWSWGLEASYLYIISAAIAWLLLYIYMVTPASCKLGGLCTGPSLAQVFAWVTRLPMQAYTILILYSIIVAGILYAYHHEAGLDRRLHLLGVSRLRLQLYKLAALTALVALPYASVKALLGILVGPGVSAGLEADLIAGSLATGVVIALVYGGATGILGLLLGRLSYTLLIAAPAAIAALSAMGPAAWGAFEWPPMGLMGVYRHGPSVTLFWHHAIAAVVVAVVLVFLGAWRGREI